MASDVLGKSDPPYPLEHHLRDVLTAAMTLLTPARLAAFQRLGISEARAKELLFSAAWVHDWGKATQEWQDLIRTEKQLPQHSLTGFLAYLWATGYGKIDGMPEDTLAVALAVLGHHGQLSSGSFKDDNFKNEKITILWDYWASLLHKVPGHIKSPAASKKVISATTICDMVGHAKTYCSSIPISSKFHGIYCLFLTLLIQADHAASGHYVPDTRYITSPNVPGDLTSFQQDVKARAADVLCGVAGCGSGKTAGALLRAADLASVSTVDRIVLCLPTRFTSNSLLRDMSDPKKYCYSKADIGLVHSEALQILKQSFAEEEVDFPSNADTDIASRSVRYEMPLTISTVDHLLMSLYHGYKYADRAFGNLMSSLVVFDEVHAYDTVTLNAIREGLHVLKQYGVPTMFMSATLPSSRRQFFGISADNTVIERDNPYIPFVMERLKTPLTTGMGVNIEASDEARRCLREAKGLKLAVYVNQVERAKALARAAAEQLPGVPVFCYHSELTPRDRQDLEGKVIAAFKEDEPVVLVATQAAELSLDISAERMITELASADVLVQRGGRLHRRGPTPEQQKATKRLPQGFAYRMLTAPIDLTLNEKGDCPAALPYKDVDVLQDTWDQAPWDLPFTFEIGLDWCEKVLHEVPPVVQNGLIQASRTDAAFGNKPQDNFGTEDAPGIVVIRDSDEESYLVIPECYVGELPSDLIQLPQYQVPLRRSKFHNPKSIDPGLTEKVTRSFKARKGRDLISVDYEITIIKSQIKYDCHGGGFDFRTREVMSPTIESDGFR